MTLSFRLTALTLFAVSAAPSFAQTAEQQARFDQLSALYADAGLIGAPEMVDCTLSGGEETLCIQLTTGPAPHKPFDRPLLSTQHRHPA